MHDDPSMADGDLSIRALSPADHQPVEATIRAGLAEHWGSLDDSLNPDLADMASSYAHGTTLVAVRSGEVVGTATLVPRGSGGAEIVRMSVHSRCRRAGVGRALVDALVSHARRAGHTRLILETSAHWDDVVDFYRACGFVLTHHEQGAYGRDAWFERHLDRPGGGRLIVLCGLPGSGKTTLARRLVIERPALRLCPDEWMTALDLDLWDAAARSGVEARQWHLAQTLLILGDTVVLEWGVWSRGERDRLREGARALGAAAELHHLDVPMDELWRRVAARDLPDPPIRRAQLESWATQIEVPDADELQRYDLAPTDHRTEV